MEVIWAGIDGTVKNLTGYRWFESISLQRGGCLMQRLRAASRQAFDLELSQKGNQRQFQAVQKETGLPLTPVWPLLAQKLARMWK